MYQKKNELYHYGIKGQKWGIRRYQNEDGTLTNRGAKALRKMADLATTTTSVENAAERAHQEGRAFVMTKKTRKTYLKAREKANKLIAKYAKEGVQFDVASKRDSATGAEYVATMFKNDKFNFNNLPPQSMIIYKSKMSKK